MYSIREVRECNKNTEHNTRHSRRGQKCFVTLYYRRLSILVQAPVDIWKSTLLFGSMKFFSSTLPSFNSSNSLSSLVNFDSPSFWIYIYLDFSVLELYFEVQILNVAFKSLITLNTTFFRSFGLNSS